MHLNDAPDDSWYPDTGASAHMTSKQGNLQSFSPYQGHDNFYIGDGFLRAVGDSTLSSFSFSFQLKSLLHVPSLKKNRLSVKQSCHDNNCIF